MENRDPLPGVGAVLRRRLASADNAAMGKSFQFSMRRLFFVAALLCACASLFAFLNASVSKGTHNHSTFGIIFIGYFLVVGASLGTLFKRPLMGVSAAVLVYVAMAILAWLTPMFGH